MYLFCKILLTNTCAMVVANLNRELTYQLHVNTINWITSVTLPSTSILNNICGNEIKLEQ